MFGQRLQTGFRVLLFLCGLVGALSVAVPAAQAGSPNVVINELMWMGSSASNSDEWIELRNISTQPVDLTGWRLTKKSGGAEAEMVTIPLGHTIEPAGFFVIANYAGDASQSTLGITPDLVESDISLVNSALQIKLYDAANVLVDTADDGAGQPLAGRYVSGSVWQSMERNWDYTDGTLATSWHTADISYHFDEGAPEFGTPRWQNTDPNYPPVASIVASAETITVGQPVLFDAGDSTDPDGDTLSYRWEFGDTAQSTDVATSHTFGAAGTFTVTLRVSDGFHDVVETMEIQSTPAVVAIPVAPPQIVQGIQLSEVFPNPAGADGEAEFIEVRNAGASAISLAGWSLRDSSRTYTIPSSTEAIGAGEYQTFFRSETGIALNNSGSETIALVAPDGTVVTETAYSGPVAEAASWSWFSDGWQWTDAATPGQANSLVLKSVVDETNDEDVDEPESDEPEASFEAEYSTAIVFNELLPNPEGADTTDEFIELRNTGLESTDLRGWKITDTKSYFQFKESTVIEAGDQLLLTRAQTKINLNNAADQLFLIDPAEKIITGVSYAKAPVGESWSRALSDEEWRWTSSLTPGETNEFTAVEAIDEETDDPEEVKAKSTPLQTIAEALTAPLRSAVQLSATVVAGPGTFGTAFFYVADESGGIQISSTVFDFPELQPGDIISFTGKVGESAGERKINVSRSDTLAVVGHQTIEAVALESLTGIEPYHGKLVTVTGTVTGKRNRNIDLQVGESSLTVTAKTPTGLSWKEYSEGDSLTITGVLLTHAAGPVVLPRSAEDITRPEVRGVETTAAPLEQSSTSISAQADHRLVYAAIGLAVAALGYAFWRYTQARKQRLHLENVERN